MAEYELIQDRLISGKGILQIPTDVRKNRTYILYSDVVRLPLQQYLNKNWNPPRSRFGALVFLRNGYVINTQSIEFQRQSYDGVNDISGQTLLAVKCAYAGILQTFVNLSLALAQTPGSIGLTPIYVENAIEDYQNLRMSWDEVRLQCYADTAINLRLYALRYDVCDDNYDPDIPPSEPEPLPYEPFAPGTPIEGISKPYDEVTSDNGNTVPFGEDVFPEPIVNRCIRIRNKGLQSGDIVFENFHCGLTVQTPPSTPFNGQATVSIIIIDKDNQVVSNTPQASFASNPVEWQYVLNDSVRQPQNSFGNCSACNNIPLPT